LASRRGSAVVALELHPGRAAGAARLNRLVKQTRVAVVRADAATLPFANGAFDACLSQEALLHIADKPAVLAECHRVLVPGGRLAFTDWIAFPSLGDRETEARAASGASSATRGSAGSAELRGVRPAPRLFRAPHRSREARRRPLHRDSLKASASTRFDRLSDGSASGDPGARPPPFPD